MQLRLSNPDHMPGLVAFLQRVGCAVRQTGRDTVEASVPDAPDERQARMELDLYLRVWRSLHPESDVRASEAPGAADSSTSGP